MADNATPSTPSAGNAPAARPTIVLADPSPGVPGDDFIDKGGDTLPDTDTAADAPEGEQAAAPERKAEDGKKEDADSLVLELLNLRSQIQRQGKKQEQRESAFKAREDRIAPIEKILADGKANPIAALKLFGDTLGLDTETVVNAFVALREGQQVELPADHAVKSELQALRDELAALKGDKEKAAETDGEKAVQGHHDDLKKIAASNAETFPLFNTDPEGNAAEAFELMFLHHQAAKAGEVDPKGRPFTPITHQQAVQMIESGLVAKRDRLVNAGKPPAQSTPATGTPSRPQSPPSKPTPAPRAQAASAPFEAVSHIRSDEEIRADFAAAFGAA